MKKERLFSILTIATLLLIGNVIPVFAVVENDSSKYISFEEYDEAMTNIYSKYNLSFEVIESSNYTPIIKSEFVSKLKETEKELIDVVNNHNRNIERIELLEARDKLMIDTGITPLIMPVEYYYSGTHKISVGGNLAFLTIKFSANAVRDESNGYYISITPFSWYHSSSFNLDNAEYTKREWSISGRKIIARAEGLAKFIYVDPVFNITIRAERPIAIYRSYS